MNRRLREQTASFDFNWLLIIVIISILFRQRNWLHMKQRMYQASYLLFISIQQGCTDINASEQGTHAWRRRGLLSEFSNIVGDTSLAGQETAAS